MRASVFLLAMFALVSPASTQQSGKVPRIGFLASSGSGPGPYLKDFQQAMRQLGYIEGQTVFVDYRYAEGKVERHNTLAEEMIRAQVDLIVTTGTQGVFAARKLTGTLPILFIGISDPVASGIVASLARPGGNVTGSTQFAPELNGKRVEVLKEAFPKVVRVAHLWNPDNPPAAMEEVRRVAPKLGLQLQLAEVTKADDFDAAFEAVLRQRADALSVPNNTIFVTHQRRVIDFAGKHRLPVVYGREEWVANGGLMSYGVKFSELYRHGALYADKLLKGAKPAELPVEQPTQFELVINVKEARRLGLAISPSVMGWADKMIK